MLGRRYSPSFLQGTRPRFASDTLMSLRAIPSFLAWIPGAAVEDICTSACIGIRGMRRSRRGCGRYAVVQYVRSVPSELGRGGLSRFSVLFGGWMFGLVRRVFRKRPQGVTRTLSAAKQGGAERPGDGCPCVGAEEICGAPSPTYPCRNEGERRLPSQLASQPSAKEPRGALPTQPKKCQKFNLRSRAQFCYREQVVLPACASSSPGAVPPHPRLVEPQAPLHAHHTERKN